MAGIIAYFRVSTKQQGASGLGMEGQAAAVEANANQNGETIVARYTEIESGRNSDRPKLAKALSHAKRSKATLCVAKLDRLARDVEFFARVMNSEADFVACDNPAANRLTLHILAAVAEAEAKAISDRTIAALAAAKARGTLLGSARRGHWKGREQARLNGLAKARTLSAVIRSERAEQAYADLRPGMADMRANGMTLAAIADRLNSEGHTTRRGKLWNPIQVARVLNRGST
jgi:DNA invertase Pin-like site-specific DNA recombinase